MLSRRLHMGAVLAILATLTLEVLAAGDPPSGQEAPKAKANAERRLKENPQGRLDYFMFERSYPSMTIPAGARRKAWAEALRDSVGVRRLASTPAWRSIGPSPSISANPNNWGFSSGRINAIAVSPADAKVILVGGATGGIWRSSDSGANFVPVSDNLPDLAVSAIAFSRSDPSIVYAGLGDKTLDYLGSGVAKSTDGGQTWSRLASASLPLMTASTEIVVHPTDPNRVFLAVRQQRSDKVEPGGLYLSTDGGDNWSRTFTGSATSIVIHPSNPDILYLGIGAADESDNTPAGVHRSQDQGQTWQVTLASPFDAGTTSMVRLAVSAGTPDTVYAYLGGRRSGKQATEVQVQVSIDAGATWTDRGAPGIDPGQFGYNTFLSVHPTDVNRVYVGARDVFRSDDGGGSWTNLTKTYLQDANGEFQSNDESQTKAHPDQHWLAFVPSNPGTFYLGNDGGLYRSVDGGNSFSSLNSSLSLTQLTSIAIHPTDPIVTYGGTQDNGTQRRTVDSGPWKEFVGGDGGPVVISGTDPSIVFTNSTNASLTRFRDNGAKEDKAIGNNETFGEPNENGRVAFYPPFVGNGVDGTLYFGTWRLWTSTNNGDNWNAPAGTTDLTQGGNDTVGAIAVARSDIRTIYVGSREGRAMVSGDAGQTWTDITAGLPQRTIKSIAVDPANAATAYLTVSGFGSGHVFKTTNTGGSWVDISANLPDIPVNALLLDPVEANTLYVGTDVGVFRSTNGGSSWSAFNNGLPPAIVLAMASRPNGLIRLATWGRGAYEFGTDDFQVTLNETGGVSRTSLGPAAIKVAYGQVTSTTATQPVTLANFGYTDSGVLITEAGVPASSLTTRARLLIDYTTTTNGGIAVVNPGGSSITINAEFRNAGGASVATGSISLAAKGHRAIFANQIAPNLPQPFLGTLTLTSTSEFAAVNLSTATNGYNEILYNALPVADLNNPPAGTSFIIAQVVDGGGWPTQILLMNTSGTSQSVGSVEIFDENGNPLTLDFGPGVGVQSKLDFTLPPDGMLKYATTGLGTLRQAYAVVSVTSGPLPVGSGIFTAVERSRIVSQAGVPNSTVTTRARLFIERSLALFRDAGIAFVNRNSTAATVSLTINGFDGSVRTGQISIPAGGHIAKFAGQIAQDIGTTLPLTFVGTVTVESSLPIAVLTLRTTTNQRGDSIWSTLPVADLNNPPTGTQVLAQMVDGQGYNTQIIGLGTGTGTGTLRVDFFDDDGKQVTILFR